MITGGFRYNGVFQEVRNVKKIYEKNDTESRFALLTLCFDIN
jgi:hypothetical protein